MGRHQGVDIDLSYNPDIIFIPLGIFYEYSFPNIEYFILTSSLTVNNFNLFVTPRDYDPPQKDFASIPHVQLFVSNYRPYIFSIVPSFVIKRGVQFRLGLGYSLNFMHHLNDEGLYPYDAGDRWMSNPNNQKVLAFANEIVTQNPLKPFTHHVVLNAEVRIWHLGIEARYLRSLHSVYQPVNFRGEFIYPFRSNSSELTVSLKLYFKKLKQWDIELQNESGF